MTVGPVAQLVRAPDS